MSRRDGLAAIERRIRRVAVRNGLSMLQAQKPDARVQAHGGYMLRDDESHEIVFGNSAYPFCADLDEIEAYLARLGEQRRARRE